jgi:tetratricopeptide (TPR) repeat protein
MKPRYAMILIVLPAILRAGFAQAQGAPDCPDTPDIHLSIQRAILMCDASIHVDSGSIRVLREHRAGGYYNRGLLYHLLGKYDLAIADYTSAIGWSRTYGDAYEALGDAYDDSDQHEKATADYAQAAHLPADRAEALNERCWVRAVRGHALDRAMADCNEALKQLPGDKDMLDTRCLLHFKMGNYPGAVADCDAAERMQKRFASSLYVGGLAKLRLGDKSGGEANISAALDADYRIADRYALYGVTR